MCSVINMNTFQIVQSATAIIFMIILLTNKCYSRNAENNVQFKLSERNNVQFVKKLRQPDLTVQQNNINNKHWDLDNPLDILEEKDGPTQQGASSTKTFKIEDDYNSSDTIKNRVPRQINNGYSSIYPSLAAFNQNMYSTPYKTPGNQYNGPIVSPTNSYNYPSANSFSYLANNNRYPQNSTFQANVNSLNFSSKPSYYPYGQNIIPNNSTNPTHIQNSWYNQSSVKNSNRYDHYNISHNYIHSNTTNFNSGSRQPNYNQFYGISGKTNSTNIYNTPNAHNAFTNPVYNSARGINSYYYSQPFGSSKMSTPSYPTYGQSAITPNFRSNFNHSSNPYYTPKTQISNQTYLINPIYGYNSNQSIYKNDHTNKNNYYNNPPNNSYSVNGTRTYQHNLLNLNQSSYIQTTPMSMPYFRPNTRSQNNFSSSNQSWTEPNHFFYTPRQNNLNSTANYNMPHKYYK